MIDDLEPTVRKALVGVLAAVYESGLVEEVNLGLVLQLFGMPERDGPYMSFRDPEWVKEYMMYRNIIPDAEDLSNVEIIHVNEDDPEAEALKGLLTALGVPPEEFERDLESFEDDEPSLSKSGPGPDEKIH